MNKHLLLTLFITVAILEVLGEIIDNSFLIFFFKPLLMPLLLAWYISVSKVNNKSTRKSIIIALLFSFIGDTLLLFAEINELYFLLGLGAFLIAQLTYAFTFNKDRIKGKMTRGYPIAILILFGSYIQILFMSIYSKLNDFTIPVIIYATTVTLMGVTAAFRLNSVHEKSYHLTFIGAILFIISDTVIAIDKFSYNNLLPFASILIMSLYIVGQFLIVKGLLKK